MSDIGKKPINSFNKTAILFHWVIAFLLMVQFLIGLDMVDIPKGPIARGLFGSILTNLSELFSDA